MKAAAMDPEALEVLRVEVSAAGPNEHPEVHPAVIVQLLADRDHQVARAERHRHNWERANELLVEAEARNAAVIVAMKRMDHRRMADTRERDRRADNRGFFDGASARLGSAIEELRVALGLPSEWRDGGEG